MGRQFRADLPVGNDSRPAPVFQISRQHHDMDRGIRRESGVDRSGPPNPALDSAGFHHQCGTWRGGMSAGDRRSPAPTENTISSTGSKACLPPESSMARKAKEYQRDTASPGPTTTIAQPGSPEFKRPSRQAYRLGISAYIKASSRRRSPTSNCPSIAVLRLDADWYKSTMICLEKSGTTSCPAACC